MSTASTWTFTSSLCLSGGNMKPSYGAPGEHDLLLGNQAHALCSSIPLFGRYGMTFVHENRTGPSRGFDYENWSIWSSCIWFQGPHISVSGCSGVWHFSCTLKGCVDMYGYLVAMIWFWNETFSFSVILLEAGGTWPQNASVLFVNLSLLDHV